MLIKKDIVIIGGGPAGMAAAIAAYDGGVRDILIIERDRGYGGILQQCIHNGFGLTAFKENLTGPEYAARFEDEVNKRGITTMFETTVTDISASKVVTASGSGGIISIQAKAIILAMGCRERSKGALNIAGTRPSGLFSAGTAQKYVNIMGEDVGKDIVILGSGDIGLIMARRMTLEGAKVHAVLEIMPFSSGLRRNIVQCLDDYGIPLYLSHTISEIHGKARVEGVTAVKVDKDKKPVAGTEWYIKCDTVLFSVGLIPENELSKKAGTAISNVTKGAIVDERRETSVSGIFACGNVLHVHDLVDFVTEESSIAGNAAAEYVLKGGREHQYTDICAGAGVSYCLPQKADICSDKEIKVYFRVKSAEKNVFAEVTSGGKVLGKYRKIAVAPGEMESFMLTKEMLGKADGEITVSIREA